MANRKKANIANFNLVFTDRSGNEHPLLEYFDIVFNALKSGEEIKCYGTTYILLNVEVVSIGEEDHAITGFLVKNTTLEVLSQWDEYGNLVEIENTYPAAPFSYFVIYLKNHRMVFVQNQKGSPTLRNFASVAYKAIFKYIRDLNKTQQDKNEKLPKPELRVVGIPIREDVIEILKTVKRINSLTLKFYPLNGDIDYSGLFAGLTTDVRRKIDSNRGEVVFRSPKNITGIAELLENAGGTVEPVFQVTYPDRTKTTIRDYQLSERMEMDVKGDSMKEVLGDIITKGRNLKSILYVSKANMQIYEQYKEKIIPFTKKNIKR